MTYHPIIIVDSGILVAYYSVKDRYHQQVRVFFERCTSDLITTTACVTEKDNKTIFNMDDILCRACLSADGADMGRQVEIGQKILTLIMD